MVRGSSTLAKRFSIQQVLLNAIFLSLQQSQKYYANSNLETDVHNSWFFIQSRWKCLMSICFGILSLQQKY